MKRRYILIIDGWIILKLVIYVGIHICKSYHGSRTICELSIIGNNGNNNRLNFLVLVCDVDVFILFLLHTHSNHILYRIPLNVRNLIYI